MIIIFINTMGECVREERVSDAVTPTINQGA
jgi:hypothetical protein